MKAALFGSAGVNYAAAGPTPSAQVPAEPLGYAIMQDRPIQIIVST